MTQSIYPHQYFGFIYIWRDRKHNKYYIGSHKGQIDDGYVCSSKSMKQAYKRRPEDFKRRILEYITPEERSARELYWLSMIAEDELGKKYYNLAKHVALEWFEASKAHWRDPEARAKHVESMSRAWTPERRAAHAAKMKNKWSDPSFRSKIDRSESNRKAWARDDGSRKAKHVERSTGYRHSEETRARMREAR